MPPGRRQRDPHGELRRVRAGGATLSTPTVPARARRRKRGHRPARAARRWSPAAARSSPLQRRVEPRARVRPPPSRWASGRPEIDAPAGALEDEAHGRARAERELRGRGVRGACRGCARRTQRPCAAGAGPIRDGARRWTGRSGRRVRAWLGEHPVLAGTARRGRSPCGLVVGAASALDGQPPARARHGVARASERPALRHRDSASNRQPPAPKRQGRPRGGRDPPRPHTVQHLAPRLRDLDQSSTGSRGACSGARLPSGKRRVAGKRHVAAARRQALRRRGERAACASA